MQYYAVDADAVLHNGLYPFDVGPVWAVLDGDQPFVQFLLHELGGLDEPGEVVSEKVGCGDQDAAFGGLFADEAGELEVDGGLRVGEHFVEIHGGEGG